MAKPNLESFAQDLYDRLAPLAYMDPTYDYPLAKFCAALGGMFQVVDTYGRDDPDDDSPGWAIAVNLNKCPDDALPWLGQFVGVRLPPGLTPTQQRAYIKDAPGWRRGTLGAMIGAAAPLLTPPGTLIIRERFNQANPNVDSPGYFQVITYANQTPVTLVNASDLTLSGNEITDATRTTNAQGDGRAVPDSSYGIWEASTNLVPNGGLETNVTGWSPGGGATFVRDTTRAKFGTASGKLTVVTPGTAWVFFSPGTAGVTLSGATANLVYRGSAWIYGEGSMVGKTLQFYLREIGGAFPQIDTGMNFVLAAGWQRISMNKVIVENDRTGLSAFFSFGNTAANDYCFIDGAQIEQRTGVTVPTAMTFSGTELTDATRVTNTQGDGLTTEGSYGIWEATTNLLINGGFESNVTGWTAYPGTATTVTQDATQFKFGTKSMKGVAGDATGLGFQFLSAVTGSPITKNPYTLSMWVYGTGTAVGKQFSINLTERGGAGGDFAFASTVFTLASGWQRITASGTMQNTDRTSILIRLANQAANIVANDTLYLDGVQVEQKILATPYVETNGATATRAQAAPKFPNSASAMTPTQGWVAARVRVEWLSSLAVWDAQSPRVWSWQTDNSNMIQMTYVPGAGNQYWNVGRVGNNIAGGSASISRTHNPGDLVTVVMYWTATGVGISVAGSVFTTGAGTSVPATPTNMWIGTHAGANGHIDGEILWIAMGSGTLTNADAATLNALGNTDPNFNTLPAAAAMDCLWTAQGPSYQTKTTNAPYSPSPYIETSAATATRNAARIQVPVGTLIDETQSWVAARVRAGWDVGGYSLFSPAIFGWRDSPTDRIVCYMDNTGKWTMVRFAANVSGSSPASAVQTFTRDSMHTVIFAWTVSNLKLSNNGIPFISVAQSNIPTLAITTFEVGSNNAGNQINGDMKWFAWGTGTLTDADAATLYALGDVAPGPKTLPNTAQLSAVMPFDTSTYLKNQGYSSDVLNALLTQKPAGLIMNYVTQPGQSYQQVYDKNATYQTVYDKYTTYQKLMDDTPG